MSGIEKYKPNWILFPKFITLSSIEMDNQSKRAYDSGLIYGKLMRNYS